MEMASAIEDPDPSRSPSGDKVQLISYRALAGLRPTKHQIVQITIQEALQVQGTSFRLLRSQMASMDGETRLFS